MFRGATGLARALFLPIHPMKTPQKSKPVWSKPTLKDLPIFFEVSLYAAGR